MSSESVAAVVRDQVFTPAGVFEQLAAYHVPFDSLMGRERYETAALAALEANTSVAVVGPRGGGKSSLIAAVCARLPATHVALRAPVVALEDPSDVSAFAAMTLSKALEAISLEAGERAVIEEARADTTTRARAPFGVTGGRLGGGAFPAHVDVEVGSLRQELETNPLAVDRLTGLERLVGILVAHGRAPVFVAEDTEAAVGTEAADGFFSGPVRAMVRELGAPCIIAVQTALAGSPEFKTLAPELQLVDVPSFPEGDAATALRRIVDARLEAYGIEHDVLDGAALERLAAFYSEMDGNLRFTLAALQTAAGHAADAGSALVGVPHVTAAAEDWRARG